MDLYTFCKDTFMWPIVHVLTKIDIRSENTHEVTRCKQALCIPYLSHLIPLISLLVETARTKLGVSDY